MAETIIVVPRNFLRSICPSIEAVGWVRIVAGVQTLLSVYLLAIWVLT